MDIDTLIGEAGFNRPRLHPNGFIQLDVDAKRRLHFWGHEDIPTRPRPTPIHDHIFSFTSLILKGALANIAWDTQHVNNATHEVYKPKPNDYYGALEKTNELVLPVLASMTVWNKGQEYFMPKFEFHSTLVMEQNSVSIITKTDGQSNDQEQQFSVPRILVPLRYEGEIDPPFDRWSLPDEELWRIVKEIVNG